MYLLKNIYFLILKIMRKRLEKILEENLDLHIDSITNKVIEEALDNEDPKRFLNDVVSY